MKLEKDLIVSLVLISYKRSIELSNIYDLYRQDYCGCIYSLRDKIKKDEYNNVK